MEFFRVILIRHAQATHRAGRDRDRPLSEQGIAQAQQVGPRLEAALQNLGQTAQPFAFTSPTARTRQTLTTLTQAGFTVAGTSEFEALYCFDPADVWAELAAHGSLLPPLQAGLNPSVILVSHQPTLNSILATQVTDPLSIGERIRYGLPTCGVAVIDFPPPANPDFPDLSGLTATLKTVIVP